MQKKYWSMVLHFYQPPTQEQEITKTVLESCYLPLLRTLSEKSGFGLTLSISGSLILQLKQLGADEFFDLVRKLIGEEKIEIVNSAMYHPLIPITPKPVVIRQIKKNSQTLKSLLGVEATNGFFPPELAVDNDSLDLINKFVAGAINSNYILVDETALKTKFKIQDSIVKYGGKYLLRSNFLLINNRQVCELIRAYPKRLFAETVVNLVQSSSDKAGLIVTANDAELFGHHYSERLQVLADLLDAREIKFIKATEAVTRFGNQATAVSDVKASTWEICQGFSFWNKNALQKKYLQLLKTVYELTSVGPDVAAEDFFDQGNSSCYLFWLSNWPWWQPGLVEEGATQLIKCVRSLPVSKEEKIKIEEMYYDFLKEMWQYHWSGMVEAKYKEYDEKLLVTKNKWQYQI